MIIDESPAEPVICITDGINQRDISLNECMFCGVISTSCTENVDHMESIHSFFIPSKENLTDLSGLMTYLNRKVGVGNICVTCNESGKSFYSLHAVRDHMISKFFLNIKFLGKKYW